MKVTYKKVFEVLVLGAILLAVTSPITKQLWAQAAPIRGEVSDGNYQNLKSDGSGRLLVNSSTASNVTSTYTFSTVAVTNAGTFALTPANTSRKAILVQNNSTVYNIYVGTTSPVTSTSGITLVPGASFFTSNNAPSNAFYALGTSSVAATTQVGEGQ